MSDLSLSLHFENKVNNPPPPLAKGEREVQRCERFLNFCQLEILQFFCIPDCESIHGINSTTFIVPYPLDVYRDKRKSKPPSGMFILYALIKL